MRLHGRFIDLSTQPNTSLFDLRLGIGYRCCTRLMTDVPIDEVTLRFVRKSTFFARYIVHPGGGGAARLVCEECGADYPYGNNPTPCAFCAVPKKSGIEIHLWKWSWEWLWRKE